MFQQRDLSYIQLRILEKFIQKQNLSYSQAKPGNVDNDLFKYHLGFLAEKEIIIKENEKYSLTDYGKFLVQKLDVFGKSKVFFKVSILPYVVHKGQLLMQKRLRHPYYGDTETVSGKILPGEFPEIAANRKLKEETGLEAEFKFVGMVRKIRFNKEGDLFEDTLYHVCFGTNPRGELVTKNEFGENLQKKYK